MVSYHQSLRFTVISEMLKGGENVHLEINKIWHMKTAALLTKMNQKNAVLRNSSHVLGYSDMLKQAEVRSQS